MDGGIRGEERREQRDKKRWRIDVWRQRNVGEDKV